MAQKRKGSRMRASIDDAVRLVRIAFRIHLLPAPRVFTHFLDAALSRPAEKLPGKLRVGPVGGFIAGTTWTDFIRNMFSAGFLERFNELQYSGVAAGAEVNGEKLWLAV